jgi:hypothetical protein
MRSTGSVFMDKARLRAFLKNLLPKELEKLLNLSRNQLRIMMGLSTGHCHLKVICLSWGHVNLGVRDANRYLKCPHIFSESVRH